MLGASRQELPVSQDFGIMPPGGFLGEYAAVSSKRSEH
jgi:hypothetical protein